MNKSKPQQTAREVLGNSKSFLAILSAVMAINTGLVLYIVKSHNEPILRVSMQFEKMSDSLVDYMISTNGRIISLESDSDHMERRVTSLEAD